MLVIDDVCKKLGIWCLEDVILYVILEFCLMCVGGIVLLWVKWVVYGVSDLKGGCVGILMNFLMDECFNY